MPTNVPSASAITPLDLEPIKAREAAAAIGPWIVAGHNREDGERWVVFNGGRGEDSSLLQDQDAEFIAHARTDIPALLAEIEHLRAALLSSDRAVQPETVPERFVCGYCTKCREWKSQRIGEACRNCGVGLIDFAGYPAAEKEQQWRPIATAPVDATTLIGYCLKLPERWVRVGLGANLGGEWSWHQDVEWGQATHWIPLPATASDRAVKEPDHLSEPENCTGPAATTFVDTPLKQAIRTAFDYPSVANIEQVAKVAAEGPISSPDDRIDGESTLGEHALRLQAARQKSCDRVDITQRDKSGHSSGLTFESCEHPDCVLVRAEVSSPARPVDQLRAHLQELADGPFDAITRDELKDILASSPARPQLEQIRPDLLSQIADRNFYGVMDAEDQDEWRGCEIDRVPRQTVIDSVPPEGDGVFFCCQWNSREPCPGCASLMKSIQRYAIRCMEELLAEGAASSATPAQKEKGY